MQEALVRVGMRAVSLGIAALALGFAYKCGGTYAAASADVRSHAERPGISVFGTIHAGLFRLPTPVGSQMPDNPRVRVASLGTDFASAGADDETGSLASASEPASFDERFGRFDTRLASFDDRFGSPAEQPRNRVLRRPDAPATARPSAPKPASAVEKARSTAKNHFRPADARKTPPDVKTEPPEGDARTAIYDITAKTVYLPDGRRLEAHSGLGDHMDDPRYVHVRMRGATPPNVYKLSMRERPFHGVRALRLTPVDGGKMHGRAGILAHSYMLGPNGQSNGCVSFDNYPEFLNAYLKGEVTRLVVVERLDIAPTSKTMTASASWLPDVVKKLFQTSDRPEYAAAQ
jgi:hypothetical protein